MSRQPGCTCEYCGPIDWRFKILSIFAHLDDWCYRQQRWIPYRVFKAAENLHYRVERWAARRLTIDENQEFTMSETESMRIVGQEGTQCVPDDCPNCDNRLCMSCVVREEHDQCRSDCPTCCSESDNPQHLNQSISRCYPQRTYEQMSASGYSLHDRITFAIRDAFPGDAAIWRSADDIAAIAITEVRNHVLKMPTEDE